MNSGKSASKGETDPVLKKRRSQVREVGSQGVWSLSSCKAGFGVDQLRDDNLESYWQSDGPQPHLVNVQFKKKTCIEDICIYADFKLDESYTPSRISIRTGSHFHDLQEVEVMELQEPTGWIHIDCRHANNGQGIRAFLVQIAILSNHQNGRDTHIRQIKIYSTAKEDNAFNNNVDLPFNFTTVDFNKHTTIR
ncbi:anaphase-promoting complex subunit 10-like [Tetranychus urticae]|uniref:Anaphase-promoting complex subunit 10 n=1 Tax=Tetranychus urticae TaxID=32264 RepID=T1L2B4_TETUR|nr:anaphase-promoting complex subunit 10-like [Tetranychus urticae]